MNILIIGGSRNIGYYSAIRFLDAEHTVTFLLRKASVFDRDDQIQTALNSGKAQLVQGDALVKEDVQRAWTSAIAHGKSGSVDLLLFTVGGEPSFSLTKGFALSPPNLVTQCLLNTITTLPDLQTRIIVITSVGLTRSSRAELPVPLKPLYAWVLHPAHRDKIGVERLIAHCAGWEWNDNEDGKIHPGILADDWKDTPGLPSPGSVQEVMVIRPGLLTDGDCLADTPGGKKYRVSEDELGGWTVSRRDVAHFVVDVAMGRWSEFYKRRVNIMY
ncbi:hypothetical protein E4T56_gene12124 [Termitomyces sp. T112]|nr:hypothetical protein E4T56_gene12124 [Termitomyces sp. T112]